MVCIRKLVLMPESTANLGCFWFRFQKMKITLYFSLIYVVVSVDNQNSFPISSTQVVMTLYLCAVFMKPSYFDFPKNLKQKHEESVLW